ncbi:Tyrosine recombinase XerC [uncultured Clostridium sp.]|uniref:tyrosine-type recombinase/integrase n=1 Tax=Waltera sp. TaxID=2815806 RepID=UPI0012BFA60A
MATLDHWITNYLNDCRYRKHLDVKTLRAYRSDLNEFTTYIVDQDVDFLNKHSISAYVNDLHKNKSPRTVKRKIASLHAFYRYLVYEELVESDPFYRLDLTFRLPSQLPRYIPTHMLRDFYVTLYGNNSERQSAFKKKCALRDIAVMELLIASGLRISELCELTTDAVNLAENEIRIRGKGNKERIIQLTEPVTISALNEYFESFSQEIQDTGFFFINNCGRRLTDQSVRNMINRIAGEASIPLHLTPHMFRHSFATFLVNQDVDIRCIQELLGHSSIKTTEIYTHVNLAKQKEILVNKNPRKMIY